METAIKKQTAFRFDSDLLEDLKSAAKREHRSLNNFRVGSAARPVTTVTATEDINRQEIVRPFLLERASTQASTQTDATAINLGAYL